MMMQHTGLTLSAGQPSGDPESAPREIYQMQVPVILHTQEATLRILVFPLVIQILQSSLIMTLETTVVGLESLAFLHKDR